MFSKKYLYINAFVWRCVYQAQSLKRTAGETKQQYLIILLMNLLPCMIPASPRM